MALVPDQDSTYSTVDFYPTQDYIVPTETNKGKPWAAFKVPLPALEALAKSQAVAEHKGYLDPETTQYYLASALKEGRWHDFGVNEVDINTRLPETDMFKQVSKRREELYQQNKSRVSKEDQKGHDKYGYVDPKLVPGMDRLNNLYYSEAVWPTDKVPDSTEQLRQTMYQLGFPQRNTDVIPAGSGYGKFDVYHPGYAFLDKEQKQYDVNALDRNAALKTAAIINKIQENNVTGLKAWERYNGDGPKAREYRNKVEEIHNLLDHPKNKDMKKFYLDLVNKYKKEYKRGKK